MIKTDYGKLPNDMIEELQNGKKELYIQVGYEMHKVKVDKPEKEDNKDVF